MNYLDVSFKLKPSALVALCDTFPRDEREWPNLIAGSKEQKNLTSVLMPLSRKLITKSYNWTNKDNASKKYKLTLAYHEAHALELWLSYTYVNMPMGYERVTCHDLYNQLNQLIA